MSFEWLKLVGNYWSRNWSMWEVDLEVKKTAEIEEHLQLLFCVNSSWCNGQIAETCAGAGGLARACA